MITTTTFSVPRVAYENYELTEADHMTLSVILNLHQSYVVCTRNDDAQRAQTVLAIKWWRTRFDSDLAQAKYAVEHYRDTKGGTAPLQKGPVYSVVGYVDAYGRHIHDSDAEGRHAVYSLN